MLYNNFTKFYGEDYVMNNLYKGIEKKFSKNNNEKTNKFPLFFIDLFGNKEGFKVLVNLFKIVSEKVDHKSNSIEFNLENRITIMNKLIKLFTSMIDHLDKDFS